MNLPNWRIRALALVQLALVLPPMVLGSVCIPLDGTGRLELGPCACLLPSAGAAQSVMAASGVADCGGCRDEEISAVRSARPEAPCAPVPATPFAFARTPDPAAPVTAAHDFWAGRPPAWRLPVLRC